MRRQLFATPVTEFSHELRPVPLDELVQYAKNIAQSTVPPTYREEFPDQLETEQTKDVEDGAPSAASFNAAGTPAHQHTQDVAVGAANETGADGEDMTISEEEAAWLQKLKNSNLSWFPWPDEDKIRRGNLMQIQNVLDRGRDPANEDLTKLGEDEKDRIAAEAAAAQAQSEAQAHAQAQAQAQVQTEAQATAQLQHHALPPKPTQKPRQFVGFEEDSDED